MAITKVTSRNGHLRLGIRCVRIIGSNEDSCIRRPLEAISDPIEVNSARSKGNEKAEVPLNNDPVKRLEKVGDKLASRFNDSGIYTVMHLLFVANRANMYDPAKHGKPITCRSLSDGTGPKARLKELKPAEAYSLFEFLKETSAISSDNWADMMKHAQKAIESEGIPRIFYDMSISPPVNGIMFANSMIPVALLDHSERKGYAA
mgnify:CR=1 FL=1